MRIPIIDNILNGLTMYRLTLYVLFGYIGAGIILGFLGQLTYSPIDILLEACVAIVVCYVGNKILAKVFDAVTNNESALITALILTLIIPVKFPHNVTFFMLASAFAMGIKYLPVIEKRHVFNPAAGAVAAVALLSPEHVATWWIGTSVMLPFVVIGGFLIMRKTQREQMIYIFLLIFFALTTFFAIVHSGSFDAVVTGWQRSIFSSALIFFATVMLTEPITSPTTQKRQNWYSILVAILYATPQIRLLGIICTPEVALCAGNIFSYFISPNYRIVLSLKNKMIVAKDTYVFSFAKNAGLSFVPGQYMEWTLPHQHTDDRGNRRYFSLSSAPSEDIQIAVRVYEPSSSYKKALLDMQPGETIIATQLSGSFVLPKDLKKPLVFIAGGVGIAPFRSMVQAIVETKKHVDIVILYANRTEDEIAYRDVFEKAKEYGVETMYALTDTEKIPGTWQGEVGYFTKEAIHRYVPDYEKRLFYISGPQRMVQRVEKVLADMSIPKNQIKIDYFPGY